MTNNLSKRLKALRQHHHYSLDTLSLKTGITKSYLSKLERGLSEPSISTVIKLAEAYQLGLTTLLGLEEEKGQVHLVKHNELQAQNKSTNQYGYFYRAVAGNSNQNLMQSFIIYPEMEEGAQEVTVPHEGEEFMYILKGEVKLIIQDTTYQLSEGDSIYFNSSLSHHIYSTSSENAEVLVVTARE